MFERSAGIVVHTYHYYCSIHEFICLKLLPDLIIVLSLCNVLIPAFYGLLRYMQHYTVITNAQLEIF